MSRKEDVDNAIWSDPEFSDLSPHAKLLYLWSFTNPRCGMGGIYKISTRPMVQDTGLESAEVDGALEELRAARLAFHVDNVLWVRSRVKHVRSRTQQIARAVAKDVAKIAETHPLRVEFLATYKDDPWLREQLAVLEPEGGWPGVAISVSPDNRAAVFERDGYRCKTCGTHDDLTIDHIKPRSHGGSSQPHNLQTLCRSCNARKGVSTGLALQAGNPEPPIGTSNTRFHGRGRGRGQGKDGGSGGKDHGPGWQSPGPRWDLWAKSELPDLDRAEASRVASELHAAGLDVTPATVRFRIEGKEAA